MIAVFAALLTSVEIIAECSNPQEELKMAEFEDRWLSVDEILGVSKDTVYKWIDKHGMPAHRMGRL